MRSLLLGVCGFVALSVMSGPAAAQEYPWCAHYTGRDGGSYNCGFTSIAQCQATVSGIGGYCQRNPRYAYGNDRRGRYDRRVYRRY